MHAQEYFDEKRKYFQSIFSEFYSKHEYTNILARYAEVGLKSQKVRERMERNLVKSVRILLNRYNINYTRYFVEPGRMYFSFRKEDIKLGSFILLNIPGIKSISPVLKTDLKLDHIITKCAEYTDPLIKPRMSVGVKVKIIRRSMFPNENPKSISLKCSKKILSKFNQKDRGEINIASPDLKIFLEIRDDFTYIYSEKIYAFQSGLPVENERASSVDYLGRFHDMDAMIRILRRGQHIVPIFFKTEQNKNLKEHKIILELFNHIYPIDGWYGIQVNLEEFLDFLNKKLGKQSTKYICPICRFLRFHILSQINEQMRGILSRLLRGHQIINGDTNIVRRFGDSGKDYSKNKHYKRKMKFRRFHGIIDGEGENIYCPWTEELWKTTPDTQELIMQPELIRTDDEIIEGIIDLILSGVISEELQIERLLLGAEGEVREAEINKRKRWIGDYEDVFGILTKNLTNKICGYKKEIDIVNLSELSHILERFDVKQMISDAIYSAKLIRLF